MRLNYCLDILARFEHRGTVAHAIGLIELATRKTIVCFRSMNGDPAQDGRQIQAGRFPPPMPTRQPVQHGWLDVAAQRFAMSAMLIYTTPDARPKHSRRSRWRIAIREPQPEGDLSLANHD